MEDRPDQSSVPDFNGGWRYVSPIGEREAGQSTLAYLTSAYPHSDEALWQERLEAGEVEVDGRTASGHEPLRPGQVVVWNRPPWAEPPAPLEFEVLRADEHVAVVSKPSGLPTLPGAGFLEHTLLWQVRRRFPGATPLHRLGRGTSGLVLFALSSVAASALAQAWRQGEVYKGYRALSVGWAEQEFYEIRVPIGPVAHPRLGSVHGASPGGKASHSRAQVLERRSGGGQPTTLFEVDLRTGRPHQIRIHLAAVGLPLLGDPLYAPGGLPKADLPGLPGDLGYHLCASDLRFQHPLTGEPWAIRAPLPPLLARTAAR